MVEGFEYVPYNDVEALKAKVSGAGSILLRLPIAPIAYSVSCKLPPSPAVSRCLPLSTTPSLHPNPHIDPTVILPNPHIYPTVK